MRHTVESLGKGELRPALCVIHFDGEIAAAAGSILARIAGDARVIAILPRSNLGAVVELMQASERVAVMMVAEDFESVRLTALAIRLLTAEIFGLEKLMPAGTLIQSVQLTDYDQKASCIEQIIEYAAELGVPRKYDASIEQCLDEMLMNALYDAVVDEQGKPVFAGIPTKTRISLRIDQPVVVEYACDGKQLAISVRDGFGSLQRDTVLRVLHKCLHAQREEQIDRKEGGAGVGLYLMISSSTRVYFNVVPGIATEAICTFDLEKPQLQLEQLGFFVEQTDVTGRLGPSPRLPAGSLPRSLERTPGHRRLLLGIAVAVVAISVTGIAAWPRMFGSRSEKPVVKPIPKVAKVALDSQPTGASVEVDGKVVGGTPLELTTLAPGSTVSFVFKRVGYQPATTRLVVPALGETKRYVQSLKPSDAFVRVRFISNPPGAQVIQKDEPVGAARTYTPAEVFVEAGKPQRFELVMPNHVPVIIEPFTAARGASGLEKGGTLVEGFTLRLEAAAPGKITVADAPHCKDVAVPVDCTLAPGTYSIEYAGSTKVRRKVTIVDQDVTLKL